MKAITQKSSVDAELLRDAFIRQTQTSDAMKAVIVNMMTREITTRAQLLYVEDLLVDFFEVFRVAGQNPAALNAALAPLADIVNDVTKRRDAARKEADHARAHHEA